MSPADKKGKQRVKAPTKKRSSSGNIEGPPCNSCKRKKVSSGDIEHALKGIDCAIEIESANYEAKKKDLMEKI